MTTKTVLRCDAQSTTSFVDATIEYAKLSAVSQIRLCITRRYVDGDELPNQDYSLIHNSPLLFILVEMNLPGISQPLNIVHDYPGLTMQRENRETEVRELISQLIAAAPGKVVYGTQPIEATSHMSVEAAAKVLGSSDFVQLTDANLSDFFRRVKGY